MKHYQSLKRHRRNQQGQALTELVICLVAFLSVISGFLLISALGVENINVSILARQNADEKARSGLLLDTSGKAIHNWNRGADNIPFTRDDQPTTLSDTAGYAFTDELRDNTEKFDLTSKQTLPEVPANNNFGPTLDDGNLFLAAAGLGKNEESETDPLGKRQLTSLKGLIRTLFGNSNFTLEDAAFMPTHSPIQDNQYQIQSQ